MIPKKIVFIRIRVLKYLKTCLWGNLPKCTTYTSNLFSITAVIVPVLFKFVTMQFLTFINRKKQKVLFLNTN